MMDFLLKIPEEVKPILKENNIEDVKMYANIDFDLNLKYNTIHLLVANNSLYVIENNNVTQYKKDNFDRLKIDYLLDYGRIYLCKDNNYTLIGYFSRAKNDLIALFNRYLLKILNNELTEDDILTIEHNSDFLHFCPKCGNPIPRGETHCPNCYGKGNTLIRLLKYCKKYTGYILNIALLLLISGFLGIITPIFTNKFFYNKVLIENDSMWYGKVLYFIIIFLILEIIASIVKIIYGVTLAKTSARLCFDMKNDVFISMERLSLKFFQDKETGNLMNRVVWDSNRLFYFILDTVPSVAIELLKFFGILTYLIMLNYQLGLLVLIPIPFVILIFLKAFPKFERNWEQNFARNNNLTSLVSDTLEGFRVVKVFSGTRKESKKFNEVSNNLKKAYIHQRQFQSLVYPFVSTIIGISVLIVWGIGGYFIISKGSINYGEFATFVAGLDILYAPLEFLSSAIFGEFPRALNSARRIFEIIDSKGEVQESKNPVDLKEIKGDIKFEDVTFSYEKSKIILKNISLHIKENSSIGIVGKTGVGKSTLVNLLARLYDVDEGKILIDNINIKDISFKSLHKNISMISQDTYLFKGTIMENIKYAMPNALEEDVIEAAKIANAHEFIMNLPQGYDTKIGEGNISLSGGQRQRISIARAVLLNSKIIIFDEATAAMDTITEKAIQQSINNIKVGKTIIMIAHRLSTLKDVDYLYVIDNKKVIEQGTMEELVKLDGEFAKLYNIQKEALKHITIGDDK